MNVTTGATLTRSLTDDVLLCKVRARFCAIPLGHVVEILRPLPIERLEAPEGAVLGAAIVRGGAIPVVDIARWFGDENAPRPTNRRFVTVRAGTHHAALLVDEVLGVRALADRSTQGLPPLLRGVASQALAAIGTLDADFLLVLDAIRIVPDAVAALEGRRPA